MQDLLEKNEKTNYCTSSSVILVLRIDERSDKYQCNRGVVLWKRTTTIVRYRIDTKAEKTII